MSRTEKLRRVVALCCSFGRNMAYYRAGWNEEHKHLLDMTNGNFWRQVNGNFLDMCVLEWCKLFADKKAKHHWAKIVTGGAAFKAGLLKCLGIDEEAFSQQIQVMRTYRDKWVAHLDSDRSGIYPTLDLAKKAACFYHAWIVNHEAASEDLDGLTTQFDEGYSECEEEAKAVYRTVRSCTRFSRPVIGEETPDMRKNCPANCNGAHTVPSELTQAQVEWIKSEIAAKKYKELPELPPGHHFYTCDYCHAVWQAPDSRSTDPARRILGRITRQTWLPYPAKGGWA
jgi:hypothetical protein